MVEQRVQSTPLPQSGWSEVVELTACCGVLNPAVTLVVALLEVRGCVASSAVIDDDFVGGALVKPLRLVALVRVSKASIEVD